MIECLDCKKQISETALNCPQCGSITKYKKKEDSILYQSIFMLVIISIFLFFHFSTFGERFWNKDYSECLSVFNNEYCEDLRKSFFKHF